MNFFTKGWAGRKLENATLIVFFLIASFLLFYRMNRADELTDGGFYSVMSIGYIDYAFSERQTTPIQWFGEIPWWGRLSFHDHPALVTLIQHGFFKVFGDSTLTMRLPFAFAGIGTLIFIFLIAKKLFNRKVAVFSIVLLASATFFIWSERLAYLEGMEIFFIVLSCYFFVQALEKERYWIPWGVSLGLALSTKYTSIFLIPSFFIFLLFKNNKIFFKKYFIIGITLMLFVISPLVIYNFMMYKTRGHFDIPLSFLFKDFVYQAAEKDWPLFFHDDMANPSWKMNITELWIGMKSVFSQPFFWYLIISVLWAFTRIFYPRYHKGAFFLTTSCLFSTLMFIYISPAVRMLPILTPLLALCGALAADSFLTYLQRHKKAVIGFIFLSLVIGIELFYNINTNILIKPQGITPYLYSDQRKENMGFRQLEEYFASTWVQDPYYMSKIKKISNKRDLQADNRIISGRNIYIYDFGLQWFGVLWHLLRHSLYHNVLITSDQEFVRNSIGVSPEKWLESFKKQGVKNIYYVKGAREEVYAGKFSQDEKARRFSQGIENIFVFAEDGIGKKFRKEIYNEVGDLSFQVYGVQLNK